MKIAHINTFSYKATGTIMLSIHNTLLSEGEDSYAIWGRGRKPKNIYEISIADPIGIRFHGVVTRLTDRTGFSSKKATQRLLERLKCIQPDIVHLHNVHGYYINIEMLFTYIRENNMKVVWTLHDCWPFTGHCAYFDMAGCGKWKTGCNHCNQLKTYPASFGVDSSIWNWEKKKELFTGLSITIVTPSIWLKQLVKRSFLKKYPVVVINNGIDVSIFNYTYSDIRRRLDLSEQIIILGVASEWTERKGFQDFLELRRRVQKDKYAIILLGLSKEQIKMLPSGIIGLERTQNAKELAKFYSAADVYFNPTYEDNYPTTNLEAIACGTPVITYMTGGSPETITGCEDSVAIEKGNLDAVIEYLGMFKAIRCNVQKDKYSKESMINHYFSLYKEILR